MNNVGLVSYLSLAIPEALLKRQVLKIKERSVRLRRAARTGFAYS